VILTGSEIERHVHDGAITIDPFSSGQVNPNSYNYHLGERIRLADTEADLHTTVHATEVPIDSASGVLLLPGHLYLGHTAERIGSTDFVPTLLGRSSVGRLGLWVQVTADLGNLGNVGQWTLEMKVVQPLLVYPGIAIGQVAFWVPEGSREIVYTGKYLRDDGARTSRIAGEMDDPHRF
jgi:dCTP deaminase